MEKIIVNALKDSGIMVESIKEFNNENNFGLLHDPIKKYTVYTNIGEIKLVAKTESTEFPPEALFKKLYKECAAKSEYINLDIFDKCSDYLSMCDMPNREFSFYNNIPKLMKKFVPKVWKCVIHGNTQVIIMEDLSQCINLNKINSPEVWTLNYLLQSMQDLANIHYRLLPYKYNIHHEFDYKSIKEFLTKYHKIITFGCEIKVDFRVYNAGHEFIAELDKYEGLLSERAAVIHNDFNIRNICITQNKKHIKVYDWEFIDIGCPMFDVLDLLLSISSKYINRKIVDKMLQVYSINYSNLSGLTVKMDNYYKLLYYSALKYAATRMNMYLLCYKREKLQYIERMYCNLNHILELYNPNRK